MHRLSNGTQVTALPAPLAVTGTPGFATGGVPGGQSASVIDPDAFNAHQEEISGVIEFAGLILDKTNNTQLLQALQKLFLQQENINSIQQQASLPYGWYITSTNLVFPDWATRFEGWWTGGGGGGEGCQATSLAQAASGPGGGSGATVYALIKGAPGDTLGLTVGLGGGGGTGGHDGTAAAFGGDTVCYLNGTLLLSAGGGLPGAWTTADTGAGGHGGQCTIQDHDPVLSAALFNGSDGSDGQSANFVFAGNGGASVWGGAGRAGSGSGGDGKGCGGGGGGAYDQDFTGVARTGGAGYQGALLGRFLP